MSDLWKLTPRTKNKGKAYGSNVKNLQDLSNYFPDKTADDLFREIIDNSSVSIENSIDKWRARHDTIQLEKREGKLDPTQSI